MDVVRVLATPHPEIALCTIAPAAHVSCVTPTDPQVKLGNRIFRTTGTDTFEVDEDDEVLLIDPMVEDMDATTDFDPIEELIAWPQNCHPSILELVRQEKVAWCAPLALLEQLLSDDDIVVD